MRVEVSGEGRAPSPRDESHLVVRGRCGRRSTELGGQPAGSRCSCVNRIPHGRGLGSSAAAIVAGVLLARDDRCRRSSGAAGRSALQLASRPRGSPGQRRRLPARRPDVAWTDSGEMPRCGCQSGWRSGRSCWCRRRQSSTELARGLAAGHGAARGRGVHRRPSRAARGGADRSARRAPAGRHRGPTAPALPGCGDAGVGCAGRGPARGRGGSRASPGPGRPCSSWPGTMLKSRGCIAGTPSGWRALTLRRGSALAPQVVDTTRAENQWQNVSSRHGNI